MVARGAGFGHRHDCKREIERAIELYRCRDGLSISTLSTFPILSTSTLYNLQFALYPFKLFSTRTLRNLVKMSANANAAELGIQKDKMLYVVVGLIVVVILADVFSMWMVIATPREPAWFSGTLERPVSVSLCKSQSSPNSTCNRPHADQRIVAAVNTASPCTSMSLHSVSLQDVFRPI